MLTMSQVFNPAGLRKTEDGVGPATMMKRVSALAKTNQTAGIEWADFARQSYVEGTAVLKKLTAARTPKAAFDIQAAYLKTSTERVVAHTRLLQDLYGTLVTAKG